MRKNVVRYKLKSAGFLWDILPLIWQSILNHLNADVEKKKKKTRSYNKVRKIVNENFMDGATKQQGNIQENGNRKTLIIGRRQLKLFGHIMRE